TSSHISLSSFTAPSTPVISTLSLHDALPIFHAGSPRPDDRPLHGRPARGGHRGGRDHDDLRHGAHPRDRGAQGAGRHATRDPVRSEEHTSELQSRSDLVCRLLLEKKKKQIIK